MSSNRPVNSRHEGQLILPASFSYSDPDLATNPSAAAQAGVVWDAEVTVAAGQAESLGAGLMPTAIKLVFSAATGQAAVVCA